MSSKNPTDQISKAAKTMTDGIKDAVNANVATAVRTKQVEVKPEHMARLLAIIEASIDEGYHKGSKVFDRVVTATVASVAMPPLAASPPTKKKST